MAVSFNGTTDLVDMGSGVGSLMLPDNTAMSMCCWINFASIASVPISFMAYGYDGTSTGYYFQVSATANLLLGSFNTVHHGTFVSFTLPLNTWHHIYGQFDTSVGSPGTWSLYIDGVLAGTPSADHGPYLVLGRDFAVGAVDLSGTGTYGQFLNGCMADAAVFNGPLTGTEIVQLGNGTLRPNTSMSQTLLGYWKLDTAAATQTDFSTFGNTGTAVGGAITNTCASGPTYTGPTIFLPPTFTQSPILQVRNQVLAY